MKKRVSDFTDKLKKKISGEKGQSIVEVALTLPIVLTILCGILDFGWIYFNQYKIDYAASAGARYAYVHSDEAGEASYISDITTIINENMPADGIISVSVDTGAERVVINITYPVRTLTFVASMVFGTYYNATAANTVAY